MMATNRNYGGFFVPFTLYDTANVTISSTKFHNITRCFTVLSTKCVIVSMIDAERTSKMSKWRGKMAMGALHHSKNEYHFARGDQIAHDELASVHYLNHYYQRTNDSTCCCTMLLTHCRLCQLNHVLARILYMQWKRKRELQNLASILLQTAMENRTRVFHLRYLH